MVEVSISQVSAGTQIPITNTPAEAPTMLVDNVGSVFFDESLAKVAFVERHSGPDGTQVAKFTINLAMSKSSLGALVDTLNTIWAEMQKRG